ncbi:MAG TPA: hypothetical protein VE174_06550 [Actinomycetota bacterium]|nr:hypothetical protein [Actinomycetota bacterium]
MIVDHGEPPEYNQFTYWSFREFFNHLIEMGLIPAWVKSIDNGTVVQDRDCYACATQESPRFIDAWLQPQDGPGMYVPASDSTPAHHVIPGGPGMGEPDIFEHVGLGAWHEWELMGGRSPNYDQKLEKKQTLIRWARSRYGRRLPIAIGYGIDPRIGGSHRGLRRGVLELVNRERVDHIVVAYHGVGFSDIMQTHMIRHELHEIVESVDPSVSLSFSEPIGVSDHFVDAVVAKAAREVSRVEDGSSIAVHLSGHGLPTGACGEYNCGADAYHRWSKQLFERASKAIERRVGYEGRLEVFHIYGDGASEEDDAEDLMDSPMEALEKRKEAGFQQVIDIPYEFDSDSRDTLIILRTGYERPIPDWNDRYESRFRYSGMDVRITNSSFGARSKTEAFIDVVDAALGRVLRRT